MGLSKSLSHKIEEIIEYTLREKFQKYNPESKSMPFHYRLLGRDRMALYSFIQSLNTSFGISIFEPLAKLLAEENSNFRQAIKQHKLEKKISEGALAEIQEIISELSMGKDTDKEKEIERLRLVCQKGEVKEIKTVKVDIFLEDIDGGYHLFDLKTSKPNKSDFKDFKRILLEWTAKVMINEPDRKVNSYIAIPYNPYFPKPYERWTMKGMLDIHQELKIAEEFWNFLAGDDVFQELLDCFERVGMKIRPEIDEYFAWFK